MAYRIKNKITFIHIPKNAGTSISHWITNNTDFVYTGKKHDNINELPIEWQKDSFCVVRNPWQRAVSWYYFTQQKLQRKNFGFKREFINPQLKLLKEGFEKFVVKYYNTPFTKNAIKESPDIMTLSGIAHCNFINKDYKGIIVRYENLSKDLLPIENILGCKIDLGTENQTKLGDTQQWKKLYNENSYTAVSKLFEDDITMLDYSF